MTKLRIEHKDGWPIMSPLGKKESALVANNLASGETILGVLIGKFGLAVVATDHKVIVAKTGLMSGQTFGAKATTFDYRNLGAIEIRTGFFHGEMGVL